MSDSQPSHDDATQDLAKGSSELEWSVSDATIDLPASPSQASFASSSDLALSATSADSKVFGDYEILFEIARGGMGVVYKARQRSLNRIVALKMILSGNLAGDDDVKRFRMEAESAAKLEHPHIVPIYEIGTIGNQHFFSMGYVEGPSLANLIQSGPMSGRDAALCLEPICDAIQYAHDHEIVHSDLKRGNILLSTTTKQDSSRDSARLSSDGANQASKSEAATSQASKPAAPQSSLDHGSVGKSRGSQSLSPSRGKGLSWSDNSLRSQERWIYVPKVTDFGLAKSTQGQSELTGTGQVLGTPSYMPPEQAEGRIQDIGPASDVYALGAILYCMVTGRPPFQSTRPLDTLLQVIKTPPIPPRQLNPSVPRDLETICLKALEKNPAKRYATAAEVRDELRRYLNGTPILARPISSIERGFRWMARHPAWSTAAAVAMTSIIAVVAINVRANQRLQLERDSAVQANKVAQQSKLLAQKRLDRAIDAVDRMMVRVASERWATRPELQSERQEVLEEAVRFYTSFLDEESDDPKVRMEAARAYARVAQAQLLMNEIDKADIAFGQALTLWDGLVESLPQSATVYDGASEARAMHANTLALKGNYPAAIQDFRQAIDYSEKAMEIEPEEVEHRIRYLEGQSHYAYFLLAFNREQGEKALLPLVERRKEFDQMQEKSYALQLSIAFALTVEGAYLLSNGKLDNAQDCYDQAAALLKPLETQTAPNARLANQFSYSTAIATFQRGMTMGIRDRSPDGAQKSIAVMEEGLALLDQLLQSNPRAFPFRMQKMQALRSVSGLYRSLGKQEEASAMEKEAADLLQALIRENPNLEWVSGVDAARQTVQWVETIRSGSFKDLDARAEEFLKKARPSQKSIVLYNVACAYSIASQLDPEHSQVYLDRSLEMLKNLLTTEYFLPDDRIDHLFKDTDLDAVRAHPKFGEFEASLRKLKRDATP